MAVGHLANPDDGPLVCRWRSRATAVAGLETPHAAIQLLATAKSETGGGVEAFELMKRIGVEFALRHVPGVREPLDSIQPWYVLIELTSGEPGEAAFEQGLITDAAIAQNETQVRDFWKLREEQSAAQKPEGGGWKHDVSVPVSQIADFLEEATAAVERFQPGARVSAFGHVGDGNMHYDILCPTGGDLTAFLGRWQAGSEVVHDIVARYDGSISAEHGLGRLKTDEARRYKSPLEVSTMQAIRLAIDPKRIMNPAVLF
jgi:FAD/FMN-containing dehydrogenase